MFCAISGVTPEEPVVSLKSGLLFERRLIEKYIAETGKCPVTGDPLTPQDIVSIKSNKAVRPRISQAASLPGMLSLFQNEYDALMLRDCELEGQLNTVRQELSYALYQSDAAVRVIARLVRERDEARSLLAQAEKQLASVAAAAPVTAVANGKRVSDEEEDEKASKRARPGISSKIISELTECNANLSSQRKKRQISPNLIKQESIANFTQISSHPLHKTVKPGILSIDILQDKNLILTGGVDGNAVLFNKSSEEIVSTLAGHSKRITSVKFVANEDFIISGSADKTVRIWQKQDENYNTLHLLSDHSAEVTALTVHATKNYFVSASSDKTWNFYEIATGICLAQVNDPSVEAGYTSAAFHPDGLILGTGSADSLVRIWDVKSQANVAKFEGHQGSVNSISFSENGYFLATAAADGVKLWDLRKLKNFRTFTPYDASAPTNTVEFDFSGSYLAFAGTDIRIHQVGSVKQEWNLIKTLPDISGTEKVTSLKYGPEASYIAVGTMDRNLRIFGVPSETPEDETMES